MSEETADVIDVPSMFTSDQTRRSAYVELRKTVCSDHDLKAQVEDIVRQLEDESSEMSKAMTGSKASLKRGIGLWVLGKTPDAESALSAAAATADSNFFLALCCLEMGYDERALTYAERVLVSDPSDHQAALLVAEAKIKTGDMAGGTEVLDKLRKHKELAADIEYLNGLAYDLSGEYDAAEAAYRKALELDPGAQRAKFRLAYNANLAGDETGAMQLYEEIVKHDVSFVGALVNLGILYEDKGQYQRAADCFQRVMRVRPGNQWARLYCKEAVASLDTIVDDDLQKEVQRRVEILQIPISDFELSVRSRNCLAKMQIRTLGDLVQKTGQELLDYKNFGETSLIEIQDVLSSKGLKLGMFDEEDVDEVTRRVQAATRKAEAEASKNILTHDIEELELSARSRQCIESLNVRTIGELISKEGRELLAVRNFGQVSLEELREKLAPFNLSLQGEAESPAGEE